MNPKQLPIAIVVGLVGLAIAANFFFFIVKETERAIVIVLGNPERVEQNAGIYLKAPWADVVRIDKRNLEFDLTRPMEITDVNQERLTVDAFARYRIIDPLVYYQSFKTGAASSTDLKRAGQAGIDRIMQNALRQTLGEVSIDDIVTRQRAELMTRIGQRMEGEARKFGVEIIDVKIRRADYPGDIAQTVYDQMGSARTEEAELIRSEGRRENTRIQAEANRRREEILADANRRALEITGQADATRNCIFAGAYDGLPIEVTYSASADKPAPEAGGEATTQGDAMDALVSGSSLVTCKFLDAAAARDQQRAEFFAFYRSMQAYEASLKQGETTILLSPDSEFFKYFNDLDGRN